MVPGTQVVERNSTVEKPGTGLILEEFSFLRILLAEDVNVNQKVALLLLARIGCRADVVSNGFEVLEALQRQVYDVILMDVQMPEMDGLEAARAVRDRVWQDFRERGEVNFQPYIIAMTANAMQVDRKTCIAAGMDDYISKPVQIEELAQALGRAAKARKTENGKPDDLPGRSASLAIDAAAFRKFQDSLGEENQFMMVSLVQDFLIEGGQLASEIHTAAVSGNLESVRRAVHSFKSSSQMFGALDLTQTCKEMEARSGSLEHITEYIEKMDLDFKAVQMVLQGWLATKENNMSE